MELVGIPYKDGGLTPEEGFDCYGLVRWVLNHGLSMVLPEKPPSPGTWGHYVRIIRPPLPSLIKYDVLMFSDIIPGLANHIGIYYSATNFLHAGSKYGGVVCEAIERHRGKLIGIGRPHGS